MRGVAPDVFGLWKQALEITARPGRQNDTWRIKW